MNDLLKSADCGEVAILSLLDLSAAFDTIDHTILCETLRLEFGCAGTALKWLRSYLSDRTRLGNSVVCLPLKTGQGPGAA